MRSEEHKRHIRQLVSWNTCAECNADRERRLGLFSRPRWVGYRQAPEYLTFAKAGFSGKQVKTWWGGARLNAEEWGKEFRSALHQRITLRIEPLSWRKHAPGYLERLKQFPRNTDADYLREFARRGASAL